MSSKYRITYHKARHCLNRRTNTFELASCEYWSVDRYAPNHGGWYEMIPYNDELDAVNCLVYLETPLAA